MVIFRRYSDDIQTPAPLVEGDIQHRSQAFHEAEEMVRNVFWRLQSLPPAQAEAQTVELVQRLKATSAAMSIEQLMN